jgi:predicted nuclease with RNAse H fold
MDQPDSVNLYQFGKCNDKMHIGIDYGAKLSGNTVICYSRNESDLHFLRVNRENDADAFLFRSLIELQPTEAFIDAPLSLPGVYSGLLDCRDFFFREADRTTRAMSPMFLGGLTARAMQLKSMLLKEKIILFETYPGYLARHWKLDESGYKKTKENLEYTVDKLFQLTGFSLEDIRSWHDIDAFLAMISHIRYRKRECIRIGKEGEGFIFI